MQSMQTLIQRGAKNIPGQMLLSICPQLIHLQVCSLGSMEWFAAKPALTCCSHTAALQWAKRRGPGLHHGLLHSLFRKRQIKLFLPSTSQIRTIRENSPLPEGSQLLIPKQVSTTQHAVQPSTQKPDLTTPAALALSNQLRHSVLYQDDELLVINKPQDLAVQGGHKIKLSLDSIMQSALSPYNDDALR